VIQQGRLLGIGAGERVERGLQEGVHSLSPSERGCGRRPRRAALLTGLGAVIYAGLVAVLFVLALRGVPLWAVR